MARRRRDRRSPLEDEPAPHGARRGSDTSWSSGPESQPLPDVPLARSHRRAVTGLRRTAHVLSSDAVHIREKCANMRGADGSNDPAAVTPSATGTRQPLVVASGLRRHVPRIYGGHAVIGRGGHANNPSWRQSDIPATRRSTEARSSRCSSTTGSRRRSLREILVLVDREQGRALGHRGRPEPRGCSA